MNSGRHPTKTAPPSIAKFTRGPNVTPCNDSKCLQFPPPLRICSWLSGVGNAAHRRDPWAEDTGTGQICRFFRILLPGLLESAIKRTLSFRGRLGKGELSRFR